MRSQGKLTAVPDDEFAALRTELSEGRRVPLTVTPGTGAPYEYPYVTTQETAPVETAP